MSPPDRPADMIVTISMWKVDGGAHMKREVTLNSEAHRAVEAAMEPRHHEALAGLLRLYSEPFLGVFLVASDMKDLERVVAGGVQ